MSRSNWLFYGDKNTSYLHHHASKWKSKDYIDKLIEPGGSVLSNYEKIQNHIVDFYQSLFTL